MATTANIKRRPTELERQIRFHCEQRGWSLRRLAREAQVNVGHLWEWKTSGRGCGPVSAWRLCNALQLVEPERSQFLEAARKTTKRESPALTSSPFEALVARSIDDLLTTSNLKLIDLRAHPLGTDFVAATATGGTIPIEVKPVQGTTPDVCGRYLMADLLQRNAVSPQIVVYICHFAGGGLMAETPANKQQFRRRIRE